MSITRQSEEYPRQLASPWNEFFEGSYGQSVLKKVITKAYLRPEWAVAAVGAGTDFTAAAFAPFVKKVYQTDGKNLPFEEETMDAVIASMVLSSAGDPQAALREIVRVLRPGGRLVLIDDVQTNWMQEGMRAWLEQAGLVNVVMEGIVDPSSLPPADDDRKPVFLAAGSRRMVQRDAVRENYAGIARSGSSCGCSSGSASSSAGCCSPGSSAEASPSTCCSPAGDVELAIQSTGYSETDLSSAPEEAAEISLGCGNPLAFSHLKPGEVVLDIGSGGGLDAFLAAQRIGPLGRVIGVDMTPAMLERARASAARNAITNVEFRQGYAEELPAAASEVDVVISNCVINLTEDKGLVFREAFRVLKPGGRLEVSDVVTTGSMPADLSGNADAWSDCISGALPEQEYLDLIAQAGFQNVTVRRSPAMGEIAGVSVYSAIVSACKPA